MLRACSFGLALLLLSLSAAAQQSCTGSPDLDFWVGTWDLAWPVPGDTTGQRAHGTNTITKTYGGCVIEERFTADTGLEGMSISVFNSRFRLWQQTWADNAGSYIVLTGRRDADGHMVLSTEPFTNAQGQTQINRMTWRDITEDALTWHWQRSLDGGESWQTVWSIDYRRR